MQRRNQIRDLRDPQDEVALGGHNRAWQRGRARVRVQDSLSAVFRISSGPRRRRQLEAIRKD